MKRVIVLLAMVMVTSCSFVVSRPPDRSRRLPLCKPGYVAPVFDLTEAIGGGVMTLAALTEAHDTQADTFALVAAVTASVAAVYGASAAYGFKQARRCRELREEIAHTMPPMPPSGPPGMQSDPIEEWPPSVEQHVDVDEDQIDVHTTIRRSK